MLNKTFTPFPVLTTKKLTLRQLAITDEDAIYTLRSDAEINKYLDRKVAESVADARRFINVVKENVNENISIYWAITISGNNELAGTICLFSFSDEDNKCELGYELLAEFQKQGIMQEAVNSVIDYAFNTIGVQKIEACSHRENQSSIKLLERCSFRNSNLSGKTDPSLICYCLTKTGK